MREAHVGIIEEPAYLLLLLPHKDVRKFLTHEENLSHFFISVDRHRELIDLPAHPNKKPMKRDEPQTGTNPNKYT